MGERLTKAQRHMLETAVRSPTGNPWPLIGLRSVAGKWTMFDAMKARGWFDGGNCITEAGRSSLKTGGEGAS